MASEFDQFFSPVRADWERVGEYISAALNEVAIELGGAELVNKINEFSDEDEILTNPSGLQLLENLFPGSAERVILRSKEIQTETHERELAEQRKPSLRKYGRAIVNGFSRINIFDKSKNSTR